ncbi:RHS repeat domain-containing protein [Pirellulaceae bacterium SH467]
MHRSLRHITGSVYYPSSASNQAYDIAHSPPHPQPFSPAKPGAKGARIFEDAILGSQSLQAALGLVTIAAMHPQNAMRETSPELCSALPRTGEPSTTFGCTEASTPSWLCFHVHSVNASVGPSLDEATTATWRYQRNQQYSITAVTTSSGSVAERYAYTAYGQPTILDGSGSVLSSSAINNRYTYTGREWDQTLGLYHFRARWMSGLAGRFMERDPIGYFGSPFGLYRQFQGYALIVIDPHGSEVITAGTVGVGSVIVAGGTSTTTVIVSGGTSTLVGGTTLGGSVGAGSGIVGIVSTGGAAAGGGVAASSGTAVAAGGGTAVVGGGLAATVGIAVVPGTILGYGIYSTPVIGTQNWLEPGLTQVAYYFFPANHPPIQTLNDPKPFPYPVSEPTPAPIPVTNDCDEEERRFKDCVDQFDDDTTWCDETFRGYTNVACHRWASLELLKCRAGTPRSPFSPPRR